MSSSSLSIDCNDVSSLQASCFPVEKKPSMPHIFRFLVSSSFSSSLLKNHSKDSLQLLVQRGLGSCRRFQCRDYSGPRKGNKEWMVKQPAPEKPQGSQSGFEFKYAVPAGLLLIAGAGLLIHHNDERRAILKGAEHARNILKGSTSEGPFALVDAEGRSITKHNLLGNWVLLYFGYTSSPDVGPEEVQKMARAIDILESKQNIKLMPIFVTIDPQRDSPSQLRAYLNEFDSRIVGLTGPMSTIRQLAREYRVYFKKVEEDKDDYLIETSHNMYLLDPDMETVSRFGVAYSAEQLSEEILKVMSGAPK